MRANRPVSPSEVREMWDRYRNGESIAAIARVLGRHPGSVHCRLRQNGGVPEGYVEFPKRNPSNLTHDEREAISRGLALGLSLRAIAAKLKRAPSSVSREVARNDGRQLYRAVDAERRAEHYAVRPKNF